MLRALNSFTFQMASRSPSVPPKATRLSCTISHNILNNVRWLTIKVSKRIVWCWFLKQLNTGLTEAVFWGCPNYGPRDKLGTPWPWVWLAKGVVIEKKNVISVPLYVGIILPLKSLPATFTEGVKC